MSRDEAWRHAWEAEERLTQALNDVMPHPSRPRGPSEETRITWLALRSLARAIKATQMVDPVVAVVHHLGGDKNG